MLYHYDGCSPGDIQGASTYIDGPKWQADDDRLSSDLTQFNRFGHTLTIGL